MCDFYTQKTTQSWLQGQVTILEAWASDLSEDPTVNLRLLNCVEKHKNWLKTELKELAALS